MMPPSANPPAASDAPDVTPAYNPQGKSFSGWLGGKSQLARRIIDMMPAHHCYCEIFAGAAWVLFKKTPSPVEVINDLNGDLVNLYRVIQHHLPEFGRQFEQILLARDHYEDLKNQTRHGLTDIQRAARFFYLLRLSYGTRPYGGCIGLGPNQKPKIDLHAVAESLKQQHQRLATVMVENQHYSKIINRFDGDRTLFYLDPPYWGCEDYYGKLMFERDDFTRLRDQLRQIKGKFIMSLNNLPEVRAHFAEFNQRQETAHWGLELRSGTPLNELIITNF